eukprot:gb/GEZN01001753.1/.p1 GENE.gb/GEZN01001753.1/~~gb/GEZN01001753.1/.p1  ORF type:complete len:850 (-),score=100.16 gb/GEZN01001753.1/:295-2664(-)
MSPLPAGPFSIKPQERLSQKSLIGDFKDSSSSAEGTSVGEPNTEEKKQENKAEADSADQPFKDGDFVLLTPVNKLLERIAIVKSIGWDRFEVEIQAVPYDEKELVGTLSAKEENGKTQYTLDAYLYWRGYWSNARSPFTESPSSYLKKKGKRFGIWKDRYFHWDQENAVLRYWRTKPTDISRSEKFYQQCDLWAVETDPQEHPRDVHSMNAKSTKRFDVAFLIKVPGRDGKDQKVLKLLAKRTRHAAAWCKYLHDRLEEARLARKQKSAQRSELTNEDLKPKPGKVLTNKDRNRMGKFPPPRAELKFTVEKYKGRVVELSMRILSIDSCEFENGTFKVQFLLFMLWNPEDALVRDYEALEKESKALDAKVTGGTETTDWEKFDNLKKNKELLWEKYWNAETEISLTNMVESSDPDIPLLRPKLVPIPNLMTNAQKGKFTALSVRPFQATISQDWALQGFPFDTQVLRMVFRPRESIDQVFLRPTSNIQIFGTVMSPYVGLAIPEWIVYQPRLHSTSDYFSLNRTYSSLVVGLPARRNPSFHIWNTMFIIFLLQALAFTCYFLPVDSLGDRLSVELTLLLTATAFKLSVAESIPNVSYLTMADKFIVHTIVLHSFLSLFVCVVFWISEGNILGHDIGNAAAEKVAKNIDRAFVGVGVLWVIYIFWFATRCYGYWQEGIDMLKDMELVNPMANNYLFKNDKYDEEDIMEESGSQGEDSKSTGKKKNKQEKWYNVPNHDVPWFMDYECHQKPKHIPQGLVTTTLRRLNSVLPRPLTQGLHRHSLNRAISTKK